MTVEFKKSTHKKIQNLELLHARSVEPDMIMFERMSIMTEISQNEVPYVTETGAFSANQGVGTQSFEFYISNNNSGNDFT